MQNKILYRH